MEPVKSDDGLFYLASLPDRDLRKEGLIIGEGRLVAERVARYCEPLGVVALPAAQLDAERIAAGRCPVFVRSEKEISTLVGFPFHRGLIIVGRRPSLGSLSTLPTDYRRWKRILVLPSPSDPENLGVLTRTASALGWDAVLLGPGACDPFGRRALRCSMGATLSLPLISFEDPSSLDSLISDGWIFVAAALESHTRPPETLSTVDSLALVMGNERFGIPRGIRERCAFSVGIPQKRTADEGLDSLNVAAAGAILLWEGSPQRNSGTVGT